jgi:hypothetical protein
MSDQGSAPNPAFPVDRKVWVPQLAMIATFIIAFIASNRGMTIPAEVQVAITGLLVTAIGGTVGWLTPASRSDITSKLTNSLVVEANNDAASPVNLANITVTPTASPDTVIAKEKV